MAKIFYDDLIAWDVLTEALNALELEAQDRLELTEHLEQALHTEVLILIVDSLPHEKHDEFVERFGAAPHDVEHFNFLRVHGFENPEKEIKRHARETLVSLLAELNFPSDSQE